MATKKQKSITLNAAARYEIQQALATIAEKEREVRLLHLGLEQLIEQHTNLNLRKEHWTLDPDHWTLTKDA